MDEVRDSTPAAGFPKPDMASVQHACTNGVPLHACFVSNLESCTFREAEPPSEALLAQSEDVEERLLRKEEKLSYHVILPRFLWRFFTGMFIAMFRVAYRYGDPKPRLCVDPSTTLTPQDMGNVNRFIPDPGLREEENPTIHYGSALMRYLIWLWNLRISFPQEEILQTTDDISAAFHRVLYHPDVAPAFSTVWNDYLIIPVSCILGSKSSPGDYMRKAEARAHFANHMEVPAQALQYKLVTSIKLPPTPSVEELASFAPAVPDAANPGVDATERRQPPYVDDTPIAHRSPQFLEAVAASLHAAYTIFGSPEDDPDRPPCINPSKWNSSVFHHVQFLGYFIDTRKMIISWPIAKRQKFLVFSEVLLTDANSNEKSTPHSISRVLGLIRHAALVAPMGIFRSLRLQHLFNDIVASAPKAPALRRWYQRKMIRLPDTILAELRDLRSKVTEDLYDPFWCRPIGLIVPRAPTITVFTDASSHALGGWSRESDLNHMWRLTVDDLVRAGAKANMGWANRQNFHEPTIDPHALHINVLEFFAIFIELWICARVIADASSPQGRSDAAAPASVVPPGGHRLLARADNTSALSWLRYASRTKRKPIRRIARFLTALLCHHSIASLLCVQGKHLAGTANVSADHLSRFEKSASWAAIMENCPHLSTLRVCLLPQELLSLLMTAFSHDLTEEWFATATTRLWTIESPTFVTGSLRPRDTTTSAVSEA